MRTTRATAVAIAAIALVSACGPQSHLKLGLRTVSVTEPRVVTPALQLVPPSAPPPVALPPVSAVVTQLPPVVPPPVVPPRGTSSAPVACPAASPFAVPKYSASSTVDAAPATQTFVQRATGSFRSPAGRGSLAGAVQVTVTDLPETVTGSGQKVKPWRVQQVDPMTKTRSVEVYQLVLPSSGAGASSPGVYLVGLAWSDPVRGALTFQPSGNGLYVLPSPVQVAQNNAQYVGIATDPNTLTTLELTRNVRQRKRVDVCGQLVDTWTVQMNGTLTTPTAQWNVTWDQQVATAYGAADVDELFGISDVKGNGLSWTRRLVSTTVPKARR